MTTYKYKFYNNKDNKHLDRTINLSGLLWNHCIALCRRHYRIYGKKPKTYDLSNHLVKIKKVKKFSWMAEIPSQSAQEVVERIDKAYRAFFSGLKRKVKTSPPKFRKVKKYKSFTLKQAGYKFENDGKIKIGTRVYKYHNSERKTNGKIKTVTVKRDGCGGYFLVIVTDYENVKVNSMSGKVAGFDFGLKCFLTSSDGSKLESPQYLKQELSKLKKLSKQCSKKKKGSRGQKKAYIKLTRLYRDIENKRRDFAFKSTLELVRKYDVLVFEDLNVSGMKKLWGRKVSDIAFASWLNILQYKCLQFNKRLIKVNRFFPSSKTCFECGEINKDLLLSDREWICPVCGAKLDRDLNAAKNLEREGASSLGLEGVSLGKPSVLC